MIYIKNAFFVLLTFIFTFGIPVFVLVLALLNFEKTSLLSWLASISVIAISLHLGNECYVRAQKRY